MEWKRHFHTIFKGACDPDKTEKLIPGSHVPMPSGDGSMVSATGGPSRGKREVPLWLPPWPLRAEPPQTRPSGLGLPQASTSSDQGRFLKEQRFWSQALGSPSL